MSGGQNLDDFEARKATREEATANGSSSEDDDDDDFHCKFCRLPEEVLLAILKALDRSGLRSISEACDRCAVLVNSSNSLWLHLLLRDFPDSYRTPCRAFEAAKDLGLSLSQLHLARFEMGRELGSLLRNKVIPSAIPNLAMCPRTDLASIRNLSLAAMIGGSGGGDDDDDDDRSCGRFQGKLTAAREMVASVLRDETLVRNGKEDENLTTRYYASLACRALTRENLAPFWNGLKGWRRGPRQTDDHGDDDGYDTLIRGLVNFVKWFRPTWERPDEAEVKGFVDKLVDRAASGDGNDPDRRPVGRFDRSDEGPKNYASGKDCLPVLRRLETALLEDLTPISVGDVDFGEIDGFCVNRVLDRQRGSPALLSILFAAAALRMGIVLQPTDEEEKDCFEVSLLMGAGGCPDAIVPGAGAGVGRQDEVDGPKESSLPGDDGPIAVVPEAAAAPGGGSGGKVGHQDKVGSGCLFRFSHKVMSFWTGFKLDLRSPMSLQYNWEFYDDKPLLKLFRLMASQLVRSRTTPTAADNTMRAQDAVYGQELILALNEDDPLADLGLCETFSILNIHHAKVEMAIRRWDHEENGVLSPALQAKLDELKRYGPLVRFKLRLKQTEFFLNSRKHLSRLMEKYRDHPENYGYFSVGCQVRNVKNGKVGVVVGWYAEALPAQKVQWNLDGPSYAFMVHDAVIYQAPDQHLELHRPERLPSSKVMMYFDRYHERLGYEPNWVMKMVYPEDWDRTKELMASVVGAAQG